VNYEEQVAHYKEVRARIVQAGLRVPPPLPKVVTVERKPCPVEGFRGRILHECAKDHGVTVEDLIGWGRTTRLVNARRDAIWRLHQRGTMSLKQIGRLLNKDHTTILHAIRKYTKHLAQQKLSERN
jgi:hypothetical protein